MVLQTPDVSVDPGITSPDGRYQGDEHTAQCPYETHTQLPYINMSLYIGDVSSQCDHDVFKGHVS